MNFKTYNINHCLYYSCVDVIEQWPHNKRTRAHVFCDRLYAVLGKRHFYFVYSISLHVSGLELHENINAYLYAYYKAD